MTGAQAQRALAGAALLRARGRGGEVDARIVLARDEVDHAADGIGTVDRRRAVLQHLDALDRAGRDVVQVDALVVARGGEVGQAAAVQQDQRGRYAQAAHVGAVHAALARRAVRDAGAVRQRRRVGADVPDQFRRRRRAHLLDVLARDQLHGQRRLGVDALDRRAGDFHARHLGRVRRRLCLRVRLLRHQAKGRDDARREDRRPQCSRKMLVHAMLPLGLLVSWCLLTSDYFAMRRLRTPSFFCVGLLRIWCSP